MGLEPSGRHAAGVLAPWRFLHHRQGMAVGVLEEGHPEIVIIHLRNQARAEREADAALFEPATVKAMSAQRK